MLIEIGVGVSIIVAIVGGVWKLTGRLREIERTLSNDFNHKLENIEKKVDENTKSIALMMGKLNGLHKKTSE